MSIDISKILLYFCHVNEIIYKSQKETTSNKTKQKLKMKARFVLVILTIMLSGSLAAQTIARQVISPIGLSTDATGNYVSHTIGQSTPPASTVVSNVKLRQGFQQPPKVKIVQKNEKRLGLTIYPNPNDGAFSLTVETKDVDETYTYEIFDMIGKLIQTGSGIGHVENFIKLPSFTGRSIYLIKIRTFNGESGDGKIVVIG